VPAAELSLADITAGPHPAVTPRVRPEPRGAGADQIIALIVRSCAGLVVLIMGGMLVMLLVGGKPAFDKFGIPFIWTERWNPVTENYGALAAVVGTIASSTIAVAIAAPLALFVAIFLTEMAPRQIRTPIGVAVELLAAVPSIVYGMWGAFTLSPFMASTVQPWLTEKLGDLPVIGKWFFGAPVGYGLLTAGLVLAIMILPFIAASMRDVLLQASPMTKESAYALGATRWDVISKVVVPASRQSLIGAVMLGLGRALGETMAVAFVIGNSNQVPNNIFAPAATIASLIANEFPEAGQGTLKLSALLALGFILFIIAFTVVAGGRLLIGAQKSR
jgi:phosphate transport system permease protein